MFKRSALIMVAALTLLVVFSGQAIASDHLFNAANSPGAALRGFANPVGGNPSGNSAMHARPGTVPGEGDPKVGLDLGTPAVNLELVNVRSGGHGRPTK